MAGVGLAARSLVKRGLNRMGFDLRRLSSPRQAAGLGDVATTLEILRGRGLAVTHAVDVGAHRGDWARLAHRVFGCKVTMFEPLEEMAPYLSRIPASRWVQAGAGARRGTLPIAVHPRLDSSSFVNTGRVPVRPVEVVRLDDEIESAELVKVDVQGFEMEVLKGAPRLLERTEVWIIETSLHPFSPGRALTGDVISFMGTKGYVLGDIAGYLRRPSDGALAQVDVCFVRADGVLAPDPRW